jgi:hypothetical protein
MADKLLWLEISNVRMTSEATEVTVEVQVKADRTSPEPGWWAVRENALGQGYDTAKEILRALDSKRLVLAGFLPHAGELRVEMIRIQFADPGSR